jgi:hypothetical protein
MDDQIAASRKWHRESIAQKTIQALEKNNITALYTETAEEAFRQVLSRIPEGSKVGYGGSLTLDQLGLKEAIRQGNYTLLYRHLYEMSEEEQDRVRRESIFSDVFLMSTNALTMEGQLVNMDGFGNRVAALFFGPPKVIVIAGINKIVPDYAAAVHRIKNYVAPIHAKRRNRNLPCATTGFCVNCHAPERFCNCLAVTEHQYLRKKDRITVVIVGEELGI